MFEIDWFELLVNAIGVLVAFFYGRHTKQQELGRYKWACYYEDCNFSVRTSQKWVTSQMAGDHLLNSHHQAPA